MRISLSQGDLGGSNTAAIVFGKPPRPAQYTRKEGNKETQTIEQIGRLEKSSGFRSAFDLSRPTHCANSLLLQ